MSMRDQAHPTNLSWQRSTGAQHTSSSPDSLHNNVSIPPDRQILEVKPCRLPGNPAKRAEERGEGVQPEDPVRKAHALKRDDASIKNEGVDLPQGRDVRVRGISDVSYRDYFYLTRKNAASIFSQLITTTPTMGSPG